MNASEDRTRRDHRQAEQWAVNRIGVSVRADNRPNGATPVRL